MDMKTGETSTLEFEYLNAQVTSKSNPLLADSGLYDLTKSERQLQVNP